MVWPIAAAIGVLQAVFLILTLTGDIAWPWWWVISPVWVPAAAFFVLLIVVGFWPRKRA